PGRATASRRQELTFQPPPISLPTLKYSHVIHSAPRNPYRRAPSAGVIFVTSRSDAAGTVRKEPGSRPPRRAAGSPELAFAQAHAQSKNVTLRGLASIAAPITEMTSSAARELATPTYRTESDPDLTIMHGVKRVRGVVFASSRVLIR